MSRKKIAVLDKGFVKLLSYDASDEGVADAARVSYGEGTKTISDNRSLIRYLLRHQHGTPFEMNFFKFGVKAPLFVLRQWHRHRVGVSINEMSGRYSKMSDDWYNPSPARIQKQSKSNKQGSGEPFIEEEQEVFIQELGSDANDAFASYQNHLDRGLARELARINLPLSTYSEMYWSCNLRSLFHFLKLRMDEHAQYEIRQYANAIYELIKPIVPVCCEAFEDYILNAVTFSAEEMRNLLLFINKTEIYEALEMPEEEFDFRLSKRELKEFKAKLGM